MINLPKLSKKEKQFLLKKIMKVKKEIDNKVIPLKQISINYGDKNIRRQGKR